MVFFNGGELLFIATAKEFYGIYFADGFGFGFMVSECCSVSIGVNSRLLKLLYKGSYWIHFAKGWIWI